MVVRISAKVKLDLDLQARKTQSCVPETFY